MNFYGFWQTSRDPRAEHEKAWRRSKATAWDEKWQALSAEARLAYLTQIKTPNKEGSYTQPSTPADKIPPKVLEELVAAGFVKVEPGTGKKPGRVFSLSAAYDFSSRVRSLHRYHLLGPSIRENLVKYCKHAFYNQAETVIQKVLARAEVEDMVGLEEGLELYVTSKRWTDWVLKSVDAKAAGPLLEALRQAPGPVLLADLSTLVKGAKPKELGEALTDLIVNLAVFEDLKPDTLELVVGLLPIVRERASEASKSRERPPLVVVEHPKDVGPTGGLVVNDLRIFLLEVAGESPRLRQDGGLFQKEEPRFLEALPPHPGWLDEAFKSSPERRLSAAYQNARTFGFVEQESEEKALWLRLSGKGRNWLASAIEDQYGTLYEYFRSTSRKADPYSYEYNQGDSKFLGIEVRVQPIPKEGGAYYYSSYHEIKPEQRQALRDAIFQAFDTLKVGVFYRWDSVLDHLAFEGHNPLIQGGEPSKVMIYLNQRPVARLPERQEQAGKAMLLAMLTNRLLPFDAFRPAVDDQGRLCIARQPRLDGYFGRAYEPGEESQSAATRVIVQPDFSVVVIGLDPAPAAELAPFCERAGGHAGQGVLTYKITRDAVIRATGQGLSASAIVARLKKHASVDVPENVLREVQEWAHWVRMVNVQPITVVRCPDREAVARVVSTLGKKAERLSDHLVALHVPKLTPAERQKLQDNGIIVTRDEIVIPGLAEQTTSGDPPAAKPVKKRGRPKKAR